MMSLKELAVIAQIGLIMIIYTEAASNCSMTSDCGLNADCATVGSFNICVCDPGYSGDGFTCSSLCTMADALFGIRYHALPGDCSRYISCDGVVPYVQYCSYGTVWDNDITACVTPNDGNCSMCTSQADGAQFTYSLLCNSYWQCQGGIAQAMCCPENTTFVQGSGCVSGSCSDTCPPQESTASSESCMYAPSADGPQFYMETIAGFGMVRRNCPPGTTFNNITCGCHDLVTLARFSFSSVCPMKTDIVYDSIMNKFVDTSSNNFWIETNNVVLGSEPVFSGNSKLVVYGLAGVTYGSNLEISLVFSVSPGVSLTNQVLLQNGKCSEQSSVMVYVNDFPSNSSLMDVTLILRTGNSELAVNSTLTTEKSKLVRMEFEYPSRTDPTVYTHSIIDDDTDVTMASSSEPMPSTTTITRKNGALMIGNTDCTNLAGFEGSIFQAGIRSCGRGI